MRVVHICKSLNGGAGLCAARIMEATRKLGVDARAVVAYGNKRLETGSCPLSPHAPCPIR